MHPRNPPITHERVKELVIYDPETGVFLNRISRGRARAGRPTGKVVVNGYLRLSIEWSNVYAARLAWFYVHGVWPTFEIDHINQNKLDNRLVNLRDVTHPVNARNRDAFGETGLKGVSRSSSGKTYRASIWFRGTSVHLGCFTEPGHARGAYRIGAAALS